VNVLDGRWQNDERNGLCWSAVAHGAIVFEERLSLLLKFIERRIRCRWCFALRQGPGKPFDGR
jgi:hypothetical protein